MKFDQNNRPTLNDLRSRLNPFQRMLLDEFWQHFRANADWPVARIAHSKHGTSSVREALRPLTGNIILEENNGHGQSVYRLTIVGALLTTEGEAMQQLLAAYFQYQYDLFKTQPNKQQIVSAEVATALKLSRDETDLLGELIWLGNLFGASGGKGNGTWTIGVMKEAESFPPTGDRSAQVEEWVTRYYNAELSVFREERNQQISSVQPLDFSEDEPEYHPFTSALGTAPSRRTLTVMFTDIKGFSTLVDQDEAATLKMLKQHNVVMDSCITANGGKLVKTIGDSYMVYFHSALDGLRCAFNMQEELAKLNRREEIQIKVRIGINTGDVHVGEDGDLKGNTVNVAKRIETEAQPGGICVSESVLQSIASSERKQFSFQDAGKLSLKGASEPVQCYRVLKFDQKVPSRITPTIPNLRQGQSINAWWWTGCLEDGISENPDFFMTVANRSDNDLPWLNVNVFPSNTFRLEPVEEVSERLMAGQYAIYRFRMLDKDGRLEKWARKFGSQKREDLSVRIFKKNSIGDAVLIDYELGAELFDRIKKYEEVGDGD